MDNTTRLADELQAKMAELDAKVAQYRRQVADEFTSHLNASLQGASDSVSYEVRKILNDSLSNYPSLYSPGAQLEGFSKSSVTQPKKKSTRDHDELLGLFTPSYLPLLEDKVNTPSLPPPQSSPPLQPPQQQQAQPDPDSGAVSSTPPNPQEPQSQPGPTRDHRASSVASDRSDTSFTTTRRSALRRSSSASVKSPRKVRFDVEGEQVPAGESPKASLASADSLPGKPGFIDDDDDDPPPPKKVSSVERLRLLGRRPYKTQEESEADAPAPDDNDFDAIPPLFMKAKYKPEPKAPPKDDGADYVGTRPSPTTPKQLDGKPLKNAASDSDSDSFDEDTVPTINTKKWKGKLTTTAKGNNQTGQTSQNARPAPPTTAAADPATKTKIKTTTTVSSQAMPEKAENKQTVGQEEVAPEKGQSLKKTEDVLPKMGSVDRPAAATDDDEDMFQFDPDEGDDAAPKPKAPHKLEDDVNDDDDEIEEEEEEIEEDEINEISNSGPVASTVPAVPQPPAPKSHLMEAIGSYKGNRIVMPVVKDARLYEQAASLGEFNTFVGSIHDGGDLNSFGASVGPNRLTSGSPKSFSERLAMEEAREMLRGPRRQLQRSQGAADKSGQSAQKQPSPHRA